MKYRTLGSTGLKVSVVGIGTWQLGGEWGKNYEQMEVDEMFDAARSLGINLIDTAECYGDHVSESLIGKAIERDRSKWIVATKFGHKFHKNFERTEPRTARDVRRQTDDSLKALRRDYIDLQQYHSWGDDQFFADDVLAELLKLKDEGKIRHIGNSVGSSTNVKQIGSSASRNVEAIQLIYNRLELAPETSTFPICIEQNLGLLARVPLASGFLSGRYKPGAKFGEVDPRSHWKDIHSDERLRQVERIQQSEVPPGTDMASWALAWCLRHPAVSCVIPGCKNVAQVRKNAECVKLASLVRDDHPQAAR
ncbi:MAG TPA: aldo/keto reductase [Tepidisphaeraceae bacterium]|nr:aldo/keto reductase [Tepidisphaeraceae bacterium]